MQLALQKPATHISLVQIHVRCICTCTYSVVVRFIQRPLHPMCFARLFRRYKWLMAELADAQSIIVFLSNYFSIIYIPVQIYIKWLMAELADAQSIIVFLSNYFSIIYIPVQIYIKCT